ncbi:4-Coumarate:CoA ligase [Salix suchowensis]|nr:4-Coumarate:CoA ligase [Salix suchowensis]
MLVHRLTRNAHHHGRQNLHLVVPPIPVASESLFTYLFSVTGTNEIGGYPAAHPAFIDAATGATVSRASLKHLALSLGYALRNHPQLKLKRGDTVMIFSPNSLAFPIALFGAISGGLRCTLANSAYTSRELEHQYKDSGAKVILVAEDGVPVAREMLKDLGLAKSEVDQRIVVLGNGLQWAGNCSTKTTVEPGLLTLDELLSLGTLPSEERFDGADTHETVLLCYSSGAVKLLNFPLAAGIPVVIQTKFDPVAFCENVARYRVTASLIVPPILVVLSRHPESRKYRASIAESGGAPSRRWRRRWSHRRGGGSARRTLAQRPVDNEGMYLRSITAVVLTLKLTIDVQGYLNNDVATKDCITHDKWFKTGDIGIRDKEGYYYIVDRRKELIKYKVRHVLLSR